MDMPMMKVVSISQGPVWTPEVRMAMMPTDSSEFRGNYLGIFAEPPLPGFLHIYHATQRQRKKKTARLLAVPSLIEEAAGSRWAEARMTISTAANDNATG